MLVKTKMLLRGHSVWIELNDAEDHHHSVRMVEEILKMLFELHEKEINREATD